MNPVEHMYKEEAVMVGNKLPMVQQEKALAELQETISMLEDRLHTVLTPSVEAEEAGSTTSERVVQSPLAEHIGSNNSNIAMASRRIRYIIERLEC